MKRLQGWSRFGSTFFLSVSNGDSYNSFLGHIPDVPQGNGLYLYLDTTMCIMCMGVCYERFFLKPIDLNY